MNVSQLKNPTLKEWGYFILAVILWMLFVVQAPCDLGYPWIVLVKFLGVLSLYFWCRSLYTEGTTGPQKENGPTESPLTLYSHRTSRLVYLVLGALAWWALVLSLPAEVSSKGSLLSTVLRSVFGILAPLPLLTCVMVYPDYIQVTSSEVHSASGNQDKTRDDYQSLPGYITVSSMLLWSFFLHMIPAESQDHPGHAFPPAIRSLVDFMAIGSLVFVKPWILSVASKKNPLKTNYEAEDQDFR